MNRKPLHLDPWKVWLKIWQKIFKMWFWECGTNSRLNQRSWESLFWTFTSFNPIAQLSKLKEIGSFEDEVYFPSFSRMWFTKGLPLVIRIRISPCAWKWTSNPGISWDLTLLISEKYWIFKFDQLLSKKTLIMIDAFFHDGFKKLSFRTPKQKETLKNKKTMIFISQNLHILKIFCHILSHTFHGSRCKGFVFIR